MNPHSFIHLSLPLLWLLHSMTWGHTGLAVVLPYTLCSKSHWDWWYFQGSHTYMTMCHVCLDHGRVAVEHRESIQQTWQHRAGLQFSCPAAPYPPPYPCILLEALTGCLDGAREALESAHWPMLRWQWSLVGSFRGTD